MTTRFLMRLTALTLAVALVVLAAGVAIADTLVVNELNVAGDQTKVRGASGTVQTYLQVNDNGTDTLNGCNANPTNPVTVAFTSTHPAVIAAPSSASLTNCDNLATPLVVENAATSTYSVSSSAPLGTTVTISGDASGGRSGGTGLFTETDTLKVTVVPRPATGFGAVADGQNAIDLSWAASADATDITDYVIYRDDTEVATAAKTATTHEVAGLDPDTEYCYTIKARYTNGGGTHFLSSAAGPACATTDAVPTNTAPAIDVDSPSVTVSEGIEATNSGTWNDDSDATLSASLGAVTKNPGGNAGTWSWSHTPGNETAPAGQTVTITADDDGSPSLSDNVDFTLIVNNAAPTKPGTPGVPAGTSPSSTGAYTVSWSQSTDVAADTVTYTLEQRNGSGSWGEVATNLSSASYTFGGDNAVEGEGSWTYRVTATDGTDDSETSDVSDAVVVDTTGPSIQVSAEDEDGNDYTEGDWTNKDVTVTFSCVDETDGSGVDTTTLDILGSDTFTASGTADSAGSTCEDNAGNAATSFPTFDVAIDKAAPTITASAKNADDSAYSSGTWTNQSVTVTYSCGDTGGSELATACPGNDQVTSNTTTAGTNVSRSIGDNAGNSTTSNVINVKVDKTNPTVTCATTTPTFVLNASGPLAVTASVSDALSGEASPSASAAPDTSQLGSFTVNVTGYDNAGNSQTVSCGYKVGATMTGFSSPVDNPKYLNKMKAGQAVPLKWRVTDALGHPVSTLTSGDVKISLGSITCAATAATDSVEEYAAGSSGLQNLGDGYYQLNWKSLSSYVGTCKAVTIGTTGGSSLSAWFTFTK